MVNAPFIQKYTIPKAQWKSSVEATSLWIEVAHDICGSFHNLCSCGSCPSAAISKDQLYLGRRDDGPHHSRSPWLKENIYNHDGGCPLRTITPQLQHEAKYLSVLT